MITELKRKMNRMLRRKEMMAQQDSIFKRIGSGAHPMTPDDDDDVRYLSLCVLTKGKTVTSSTRRKHAGSMPRTSRLLIRLSLLPLNDNCPDGRRRTSIVHTFAADALRHCYTCVCHRERRKRTNESVRSSGRQFIGAIVSFSLLVEPAVHWIRNMNRSTLRHISSSLSLIIIGGRKMNDNILIESVPWISQSTFDRRSNDCQTLFCLPLRTGPPPRLPVRATGTICMLCFFFFSKQMCLSQGHTRILCLFSTYSLSSLE